MAVKKMMKGQTTLKNPFGPQLPQSSAGATAITRDIGVFIAADMRPFSVVENAGFRRLIHTLEPKYTIPSRSHIARTVVPNIYEETKAMIKQTLKEAESIAITTDGWTSRGTLSYITVTAHTIASDWKMVNVVLQTRPLFESHTGTNTAEVLQAAITDWELTRPNHGIRIVTDDAHNMDVAAREARLEPHIKCFAHTITLATQAGLSVARVARLLGRVRRVAAFFHRSTTATIVLMSKQKLLQLPPHKLIMDVTTRWNSTVDMLDCYLEQQAAIAAALTSPEIRQNARTIDTLDSSDFRDAKDLVKLLHPLKTATTVLCEEKSPAVSLIVPLKNMIEQSMTPNDGDSTAVADTKSAILSNISGRYSGDAYNFLLECTALDPRFRTLPELDHDQRTLFS
ncbi:zinc finger BED domain-containing protein 4-like [Neoarius graeffei]|uniref:zinc finger BED domain-containing protein 4-like n=1 Tax=Neoarius graeffei TaxID=443677 RepID=UPI00298BDFDF|nr:zinc finger BED domain-containing protein 4-like [Neoarius graeffei]